jgi:hypothetical protein
MKKVNVICGVDAGNISVVDLSYIKSKGGLYGKTAKKACSLVTLPKGEYKVKIVIKECWEKLVETEGLIRTKGKIVIGDICYLFSADEPSNDNWIPFLEETDYLRNDVPDKCIFVNTGGDGCFETTVTFKELK